MSLEECNDARGSAKVRCAPSCDGCHPIGHPLIVAHKENCIPSSLMGILEPRRHRLNRDIAPDDDRHW